MAKLMYGDLLLKGNSGLRLEDGDTNYAELKAAAAMGANITFTLPATVTANGVITTDGSGTLSASLLTNANVDAAAAIDATKIHDGSVSNTEFGYLNGVTSAIQTQFSGKAGTALDNLTVASLAAQSLLVGSSGSAVVSLAAGGEGTVLKIVGGAVTWAADAGSRASHVSTWINADTATKSITHSLGTTDVMVQIYDIDSGETIDIDTIDRTSTSAISVTASEAPDVGGSGWKVMILDASA